MFLPTGLRRSTLLIAAARTADTEHAAGWAQKAAVLDEQRAEMIRRAKRVRRYPVTSGERTALPAAARLKQERRGTILLRQAGSETYTDRSQSNGEYRARRLPRMAQSMARGGKGRGINADTAEHFVSSFRSQWAAVERLAAGFLPEKIEHKAGWEVLQGLAVKRGFTLEGTTASSPEFRALMRVVNPASGRAGGRPRKVRSAVGDASAIAALPSARGVLAGTYEPGLVGMAVGSLRTKVPGCTCGGFTVGSQGYRGCSGHGYGATQRPFIGRKDGMGNVTWVGDWPTEEDDTED